MDYKLMPVPVDKIDEGERQRKEYPGLDSLADSIKDHGLIHPIAVMENGDETYTLLAGGRRLRVHQKLELKMVDAKVFPKNLDEYELRSIELAENIEREDLSYAEKAEAILQVQELYEQKYGHSIKGSAKGHTQDDTAELLGKSRSSITKDIELAKAIRVMPELADCKNKSEAYKLLRKRKADLLTGEISRRVEKRLSETGKELLKRKIIKSYVIGDFREKVKELPDKSMHLIEIDPPYAVNLTQLMNSGVETDGYNEIKKADYLEFMEEVIRESERVLRNNGWLLLWFAHDPWFEPLFQLLEKYGLKGTRIPAVWTKNGPGHATQPSIYMASTYEGFFYVRKGDGVLHSQGRSNVFRYPTLNPNKKIHPTERPIEMMMDILKTFCHGDSRICVPFGGSGNTVLAAYNLGMDAVCFDLSESYREKFIVRVNENEPPNYRSFS